MTKKGKDSNPVVRRERQCADPEFQRSDSIERRHEMGTDDVDGAGG